MRKIMDDIMESRLINISIRSFYLLFAIIFSWLFLQVLLENKSYSYPVLPVLGAILLWCTGAALLFKIVIATEHTLKRHPISIALGLISIATLVQAYFAHQLELETAWDIEAVYKGAVTLAQQKKLAQYEQYFSVYPHNLGPATFLSWIYCAFPQEDIHGYYVLGASFNILAINTTFFIVFLICRELKNTKSAFFALLLCLGCIPIYFYVPIFYSDTFSLPFGALIYYLYLMLLKSERWQIRLLLACAIGAACALGAIMKFTILIVTIAIFLELIIRHKLKQLSLYLLLSVLIFQGLSSLYSKYLYNSVINKERVSQQRYPYSHWLMMGLAGDGAYNGDDDGFTRSFPTLEEKAAANINVVKQRLKDYGVQGYLLFLNKKQQHNFGSGHYGVHYLIDDNPLRRGWLHEYATEDGQHFETFRAVTQGYHVFLFTLIILGALYDTSARNTSATQQLVIRLSIFGIYLFLLLWEANARLVLHFMPMFILAAALRYEEIYKLSGSIKHHILLQLKSAEDRLAQD